MQKFTVRTFLIKDIDYKVTIEVTSRKEVLSYLDEYLCNLLEDGSENWFNAEDDTFTILYDDGHIDTINVDYDGHKIKKQHIASIVYNNACTAMVYGNFEINEYGVVTPSFEEIISSDNIIKVNEQTNETKKGDNAMKIKEIKVIDNNKLRRMCIDNNWYTKGSTDDYNNMFKMCKKDNITTKQLYKITKDIYDHTDVNAAKQGCNNAYSDNDNILNMMIYVNDCTCTFYQMCE